MPPSSETLYLFRRLYDAAFKHLDRLLGVDPLFESDVTLLGSYLMRLCLRSRTDLLDECLRYAGARTDDPDVYVTLDYFSNVAWLELSELITMPGVYRTDKGHLPISQQLARTTRHLSPDKTSDLWSLLVYFTTLYERALLLLGGYRYFHVFYAYTQDESELDFERAYDAAYQDLPMPQVLDVRRIVSTYFEHLQNGGAYRWDIVTDTLQMIGRYDPSTRKIVRIRDAETIYTRHGRLLTKQH